MGSENISGTVAIRCYRQAGGTMQSLTIKFEDKPLEVLRGIATAESRSIGFLVREAVAFWLAHQTDRTVCVTPAPTVTEGVSTVPASPVAAAPAIESKPSPIRITSATTDEEIAEIFRQHELK